MRPAEQSERKPGRSPPGHATEAAAGGRSRATPAVWLLLALLMAGAFTIVLVGVRSDIYDLDRYAVPKAMALHATALLALLVLLPRWRRIELGLVDALLVAFLIWSAASALLARNHWLALSNLGISFSGVVIYFAARAVAPSRGAALIAALAFAAAIGSALGVAQAYGADWSFLGTTRPPGGTFGNRNFLAHLTAIATPLLLLVRVRAKRRLPALLAALGLVVAAAAIVLTRSRAAWLGLAAGCLAMGLIVLLGRRGLRASSPPPGQRLRGAVLALALGALAALVLPNRLDWRSPRPYAETLTRIADFHGGSGAGRLVQYRNSLKLLRFDPVLGVGPGNWFVQYPRVTSRNDPAYDSGDRIPTNPWPSSDWVTFVVERGPAGAFLLLAAALGALLACLRGARSGDRNLALGSAALAGALVAAFVCGLFDAVLLLPAPTFFVFAAAGALLPRPRRLVIARPLAGRTRLATMSATAFLALAVSATTAGQLHALLITRDSTSRATIDRALRFDPGDYRLNLIMLSRGSCASRIRYARAAAALLPYHTAPKRALRACGVRVR